MIKSDTGWVYSSTAVPVRGFHDYERIIEFEEGLSEEDKNKTIEKIKKDQPGYFGWSIVKLTNSKYKFTSFLDSSG